MKNNDSYKWLSLKEMIKFLEEDWFKDAQSEIVYHKNGAFVPFSVLGIIELSTFTWSVDDVFRLIKENDMQMQENISRDTALEVLSNALDTDDMGHIIQDCNNAIINALNRLE